MKVVDQDEIFYKCQIIYFRYSLPIDFPIRICSIWNRTKAVRLLTPTYVFDAKSTRGIGLNNVGWFQYINDYITSSIKGGYIYFWNFFF